QNQLEIARPRYTDSGVESLFAEINNAPWEVSWDPDEPSNSLRDLIAYVRNLISDLRQHPLSTLKVELETESSELQLHFSNRGTLPFEFYGFGSAASDRQVQLRLQFCSEEELALSRSRSPIQLLRQPPLIDQHLPGAANGEIQIDPGEAQVMSIN